MLGAKDGHIDNLPKVLESRAEISFSVKRACAVEPAMLTEAGTLVKAANRPYAKLADTGSLSDPFPAIMSLPCQPHT